MVAIALLLAGVLGAAGVGPARAAARGHRLPDLAQGAPAGLQPSRGTRDGEARWVLGFRSAVRNVGAGPLIVHGHRSSRTAPMAAYQQILRADGATRRVPGAGRMRYVVAPTHQHWHLMHFDR